MVFGPNAKRVALNSIQRAPTPACGRLEVIAHEIVEDLEAALTKFAAIAPSFRQTR
jgi:hypothetical protein